MIRAPAADDPDPADPADHSRTESPTGLPDRYPFNLPVFQQLNHLEFSAPVTLFTGENGSGKSTLIELVAAATDAVVIGGESFRSDKSLSWAMEARSHVRCAWNKRTHRGFFLRAEDFYNFARKIKQQMEEMEADAREFDGKFHGTGRILAVGAMNGQKRAMQSRYGDDLHHLSHGESFLRVFQERFVPGGLYILDEPEAPLSPTRQLTLLSMILQMVTAGGQFIIATHSPILMACPHAIILSFDGSPPAPIAYEDTEHVSVTRAFLNHPESFLRHL
ncbi:AAA family ATPase [bacterium]|nr:AAA family ATPase [candidate division CSSED10-310 bacterium]